MKQRILTGTALVALLILLFFSKTSTAYVFDLFIGLIAIYAGYEMSELLKKMGLYNNKWVIIAYPVLAYFLYKICLLKNVEFYLLFIMQMALIILLVAFVLIIGMVFRKRTDNEIKTRKLRIGIDQFSIFKGIQTLFGIIYPCLIVMLLILVNNLQEISIYLPKYAGIEYEMSMFFLIYTFAIPAIVDTFAMLTGSIFKGPKLCPSISPKKTVSGAVGGFVWGSLCAIALFFIFNSIESFRVVFLSVNLTWWKVLIVGLFSSILCQLGDIFESFLKRKANVKDSGDFLPGHGGILDRTDSHIVNILIVFIFMLVL